uniref:hypothetical protein n=1 Tax=Rhodococcus sp. 05-2221-1B TaxID=2022498 RepID=UPI001595B517|nr:hypothetical protein [Rhodococcus sp. 05-2221-1B]
MASWMRFVLPFTRPRVLRSIAERSASRAVLAVEPPSIAALSPSATASRRLTCTIVVSS